MKIISVGRLVFLIACFLVIGCNTFKYENKIYKKPKTFRYVNSKLALTESIRNDLKHNDTILAELYKTIEDSVEISKIESHVNRYLAYPDSSKYLLHSLKMERYVKKTGGSFKIDNSIDPANAIHVDNIEEFDSLRKQLFKRFKNFRKSTTKKDSL